MGKAVDLSAYTVEARWACPNCTTTAVTRDPRPHSQMHACRGLKGLTAPLVNADLVGTTATARHGVKVEAREREDSTNGDDVQYDGEGRAVMSIVTTRDDGQDCAVLAPVATTSPVT